VGIHVNTIRHTEYRKYEKPDHKWQLVDIMGYISFLPNTCIRMLLLGSTLQYNSDVQYKGSNWCFQTHQEIWSCCNSV